MPKFAVRAQYFYPSFHETWKVFESPDKAAAEKAAAEELWETCIDGENGWSRTQASHHPCDGCIEETDFDAHEMRHTPNVPTLSRSSLSLEVQKLMNEMARLRFALNEAE